jgi:hypothetical protein
MNPKKLTIQFILFITFSLFICQRISFNWNKIAKFDFALKFFFIWYLLNKILTFIKYIKVFVSHSFS